MFINIIILSMKIYLWNDTLALNEPRYIQRHSGLKIYFKHVTIILEGNEPNFYTTSHNEVEQFQLKKSYQIVFERIYSESKEIWKKSIY
jgi:hypothetical protein